MVTSDRLLQLIAQLQRERDAAQARRILLKYIRTSSRAQLAGLFVLDKERNTLVLLAQSGRRPVGADQAGSKGIPVDGLFGSVLATDGLLHIFDPHNDPRTLEAERSWMMAGGSILLSVVNAGKQPDGTVGVLVLSLRADGKSAKKTPTRDEGELSICLTLLAA